MQMFLWVAELRKVHDEPKQSVHITPRLVDVDDEDGDKRLRQFYGLLNCDTIDIVEDEIDGELFDLIVDDESLLKANPVPSWLKKDGQNIYGNILFAHCNYDTGETLGLNPGDDKRIIEEFNRRIGKSHYKK